MTRSRRGRRLVRQPDLGVRIAVVRAAVERRARATAGELPIERLVRLQGAARDAAALLALRQHVEALEHDRSHADRLALGDVHRDVDLVLCSLSLYRPSHPRVRKPRSW